MDVSLIVRRQKTSILLEAKETTTVYNLKERIQGITRVLPENQQLYQGDKVMENNKVLVDYGITGSTALPQSPAQIGLAFRENETSEFESLEITPYSTPPEIPEVLRGCQEADNHKQNMA